MKVHRENTQRTRPDKPIIVYYKECGTGRICSAYISCREGKDVIRFTDGQWNPADSCYFTPQQAKKHTCTCIGCRAGV